MTYYNTATTCNQDPWPYWQADAGTGTTCTAFRCELIWENWNSETSGATTATTYAGSNGDNIWYAWNSEEITPIPAQITHVYPTRQELRAREEEARVADKARKKEYAEQEKKREAAEAMALDLLEMLIGPQERKVYEETGRLLVKGKEADYMISKQFGVERVERGKIVDLCIHLRNQYGYPETDNVIALALAVKDDEEAFNKMANEHGSRERARPLMACANGFD